MKEQTSSQILIENKLKKIHYCLTNLKHLPVVKELHVFLKGYQYRYINQPLIHFFLLGAV